MTEFSYDEASAGPKEFSYEDAAQAPQGRPQGSLAAPGVPGSPPPPQLPGGLAVDPDSAAVDRAMVDGLKRRVTGVLRAFGQGYENGYGHEATFQLSDEHLKQLQEHVPDALAPVIKAGHDLITGALGNTRWGTIAGSPEFLAHQMNAVYAGLQASVAEAIPGNLGRDLASMPDAFFGMPHALAAPKPFVKPTPIEPIMHGEAPAPPSVRPRSELARTGDPIVDGILDHPVMRDVINNGVVDRSHEVPNSWGASMPENNPTTYIDHEFPKTLTVDGKTIDVAEPALARENAEAFAVNRLMKAGLSRDEAMSFSFWEVGNRVEDAWYEANGMDAARVEEALKPYVDKTANRGASPDRLPPDLFRETYPNGDPLQDSAGTYPEPSPELIQRGREILGQSLVEDALQGVPRAPRPGVFAPQSPFELARAGLLTADKAEEIAGKLKGSQEEIENRMFGDKDTADKWRKLHRQSDRAWDSANDEKARDYDRQIAELEEKANLSPEDQGYLNGEGWPEYSDQQAWRDHARDLRDMEGDREDRVTALGYALRRLPGEGKMPGPQDSWTLAQIQHAMSEEAKAGGDPETLIRDAFRKSAERYGGGADAEEIVRDDMARLKSLMENPPGPRPALPDLSAARDLGVIGPDEPLEAKRAEDVPKVMEARRTGDEKVTQEVGGEKPVDRWEQRWKKFTSKIDKPEDVQQIIREAATDDNGNFEAARSGDIRLRPNDQHRLGEAAGVDPATIDPDGVGRVLRNDNQVRVAMQVMLEVAEHARAAGEELARAPDDVNLQIKFQEAMMRRDLAVEQIVGLRAEWGRTGNVFQEFLKQVKEQEAITDAVKQAGKEGETRSPEERKRDTLNAFLRENGSSAERLAEQANQVQGLSPKAAAKYLSQQRDFPAPSLPFWLWVQGLISGPVTHTKYILANGLYAIQEHIITPTVAATMGALRMDPNRVFFGEPMAATWGMITGFPDAIKAVGQSIRDGVRAPLISEIEILNKLQTQYNDLVARNEKIPRTLLKQIRDYDRVVNPITQMGTPEAIKNMGIWGRLLGAPGDAAMGIHTFYKVLGERASLNSQAYRRAALETKEDPAQGLWDRFNYHRENPDIDMHIAARADAYKGTFMQELGPKGQAWQQLTKEKIPWLKWLFPFSHIPINLMKAAYEYTPFAYLDSTMRADIKGENGQVAADKARARVIVGSAIMTYFGWQAATNGLTGSYPRDPNEQKRWKMLGMQPNSVRLGDWWVSLNKFGMMGSLAQLAADVYGAGKMATSGDDDAMFKAAHMATASAVNLVKDEVGMLSLSMFIEALTEEKKGARWVGNTAASFMPYSSLLGQSAAFMDPHARDVKGVLNSILYKVPFAREGLPEKLNTFGEPVANPMYHSIMRMAPAATDKVTLEMDKLGMHPAAPHNVIGGVKLSPQQAGEYQAKSGAIARTLLEQLMGSPGYEKMTDEAKIETIKEMFKTAHAQGRAMMQVKNDNLIRQGTDQKLPKRATQ